MERRNTMLQARRAAVQAANLHRLGRHLRRPARSVAVFMRPTLLGPRQWQQAVHVCRQFRLLPEDVLRIATTGRVPEEVNA